jgi:hypothetical protein
MVKTSSLWRTAKRTVYALTIASAAGALMAACLAAEMAWTTRVVVAIVVVNGVLHTTSSFLEVIDRSKRSPSDGVSNANALVEEPSTRGPSASTNQYDETPKKSTDDEPAVQYSCASLTDDDSSGEDILSAPTAKDAPELSGKPSSMCPVLPKGVRSDTPNNNRGNNPEPSSTVEPKSTTAKQQAIDDRYPTTRTTFRPLSPADDSILSRSRRFRRLEAKLAAGIWYEREYQKTKRLSPVFNEYDTLKKQLLLKAANTA